MPGEIDFKDLVEGALIFTAAIAWNSAAKESIEALYPKKEMPHEHIRWQMLYAAYVTVFVIILLKIYNFSVQNFSNFTNYSHENNIENKHEYDNKYKYNIKL